MLSRQDEGVIYNNEDLAAGEFQIVFSSPEMLFMSKHWRNMLTSDVYSSQLQAFVIDEAHTCKKWYVTYQHSSYNES